MLAEKTRCHKTNLFGNSSLTSIQSLIVAYCANRHYDNSSTLHRIVYGITLYVASILMPNRIVAQKLIDLGATLTSFVKSEAQYYCLLAVVKCA